LLELPKTHCQSVLQFVDRRVVVIVLPLVVMFLLIDFSDKARKLIDYLLFYVPVSECKVFFYRLFTPFAFDVFD
jgi:hypothetical protein